MLGSDPTGRRRSDCHVQYEELEVPAPVFGDSKKACPVPKFWWRIPVQVLGCSDSTKEGAQLPQQEPGSGCSDKEQAETPSASPLQHQHLTGLHKQRARQKARKA